MTAAEPLLQVTELPVSTFSIPKDNDALRDAITTLAGHINAAEYRFIKLLAALLERGAWLGDSGFKTPAHWLNYACGIDLGAAREKVRVAKCLANFPRIEEAFRTGTISYSKVRAMTRSATPENEEFLLMFAQHGTAQHVENLVRKHQYAKRLNTPEQDQAQYDAREFKWYYDEDGMLVFKGKLTPEDGAVFLKAMEAWFDVVNEKNGDRSRCLGLSPFFSDVSAETSDGEEPEVIHNVSAETSVPKLPKPNFAQKRADALVLMAEHSLNDLSDDSKSLSNPEKYQIIVHLEPEKKRGQIPSFGSVPLFSCSVESGAAQFPLSATTARRLACDASLVPVLEDGEGNVLNVGRKTRTVPPALRRALKLRDQGCRFPGCTQARYVDAHHVRHWCDGGETSLNNLITLCRYHHRLLHQEGYEIVKKNDGFFFRKPDGETFLRALPQQFNGGVDTGETPVIQRQHEALGLAIDAATAVTLWGGEECDYDLGVEGLMAMEPDQGNSAPRYCL